MKKLLLVPLFAFLAACGSPDNSAKFVGKWEEQDYKKSNHMISGIGGQKFLGITVKAKNEVQIATKALGRDTSTVYKVDGDNLVEPQSGDIMYRLDGDNLISNRNTRFAKSS